MKTSLSILLILISLVCSSQDLYVDIKNYNVDIKVSTQGYFDVTEQITIDFREQRRGIIRKIPYVYEYKDFANKETARRPINHSGIYTIVFENLSIPDYQSVTNYENSFLNIRIGDPNVYLSGINTYTISYRVWGALNQFEDCVEFNWNIIGTLWEFPIEKASWKISFPKPVKFNKDDIVVYTGVESSKEQNCTLNITPFSITGSTTDTLRNFEGVTSYINLPPDYFTSATIPIEKMAQNFYVNYHKNTIKANKDASYDVTEEYDVVFVKQMSSFYRNFKLPAHIYKVKIDNLTVESDFKNEIKYDLTNYNSYSYKYNFISIYTDTTHKFNNNVKFKLKYKIWGYNSIDELDSASLLFDIIGVDEPVKKSEFSIEIDSEKDIDPSKIQTYRMDVYSNDINYEVSTKIIAGIQPEAHKTPRYSIKYNCKITDFDYSKVPAIVYAKEDFIDSYNSKIKIQKDGKVDFKVNYQISSRDKNLYITFKYPFYRPKNGYFSDYNPTFPEINLPSWTFFGKQYSPDVYHDYYIPTYYKYPLLDKNISINKDVIFQDSLEYSIFDILPSENGNYNFNYPVFSCSQFPVDNGIFEIELPNRTDGKIIDCQGVVLNSRGILRHLELKKLQNTVNGETGVLRVGDIVFVNILFSKDYISKSFFVSSKHAVSKNIEFVFFIISSVFVFFIWYFFGRDKKETIVVQYYPPSGLTSAEAGYIWDFELHKRDMIALIFEWAGKNYIEIVETGNDLQKDFELIKKAELPADAKDFEKTFFSGLFTNRNSVKVSTLRDNFYSTFNKSYKELLSFAGKSNFFSSSSLPMQNIFKVFGILFSIIAFIFLFINILWFFSLSLTALSLFLYKQIMPRYGHFGKQKYQELLGFKEFLEKAEFPRLEMLVKDNPQYFEQTLAYATVLGCSSIWAEKFAPLLTEPPQWYKSEDLSTYSTKKFVNSVIFGMHKMETDFQYFKPKTYSSGYSGSSKSSGYKFSLGSNSFSSGSSHKSSSGGGYSGSRRSGSGGGFGGGGGSSW